MMFSFGIRAETKRDERRTPLVPHHLRDLVREHRDLRVYVQRSNQRAFANEEFVGIERVELVDSVDHVPVTLGVKELAVDVLLPERTYAFFSHTFKGQSASMEMLQALLDRGATLVEYEMLVDDVSDQDYVRGLEAAVLEARERCLNIADRLPKAAFQARTVHFCRFAGIVGAFESLWALGRRLLQEGLETPLATLQPASRYGSWTAARREIERLAREIATGALPESLRPLVIGVTGFSRSGTPGKTAAGVLEVLDALGAREVALEELAVLDGREPGVRWVRFDRAKTSRLEELELHLENLTVLIHCIRWMPWEPSVVTRGFARRLWSAGGPCARLRVIGDISADPGGSIEFSIPTSFQVPTYVYEPHRDDDAHQSFWRNSGNGDHLLGPGGPCRPGFEGDGPLIMAIDNLPSAFSREASEEFSGYLMAADGVLPLPYQLAVLGSDRVVDFEGLEAAGISRPLRRATMAFRGSLTPDYAYLQRYLETWREET